jgi:anthranilate phosphoribosyltransferase
MSEAVNWAEIVGMLLAGNDLTAEQSRAVMATVVAGDATDAQIAGFAVALRAKGETATEVDGLVTAMLDVSVPMLATPTALDIVGTGGDASNSVNISTLAAVVAAAAGAVVVKHGNRAASSRCGSADVLEALGVSLELSPDGVARCVSEAGIGFCFAPTFHPAMRFAGPARRQLGVPTVFNILGPLANPAQPVASLIGVADRRLAPVIAGVFLSRGRRALVVRGNDGLDEITVSGPTEVWEVTSRSVAHTTISPEDLGLPDLDPADLGGGDAATNAETARRILAGESTGSLRTVRQAVVLNAAAGLVVYQDAASGVDSDTSLSQRMGEQIKVVNEAIDSGAAARTLENWVSASTA